MADDKPIKPTPESGAAYGQRYAIKGTTRGWYE